MITSTITSKTIDVSNFERISIAEDMIDSIQFSIPSTYEGTNLSTGTVFALYVIPGGSGDMTELASSIEGDNILAVWELKDGVVSKKGMVEFQIVILVGSTILYQTKTARFFVDRKLDPSTLEFTPNILTELLASVIEQRVLIDALYAQLDAIAEKESIANVDTLKGVGWTDETVKGNADDIDTLEADVNTAGSVLKSINDNAEGAVFTPVGGIDAVTIGGALEELDTKKAVKDDIVDDFIGGLGKIASANDAKELYELIDTRVYGLDINETTGANTRLLDAVGMTVTAPDGTKAITSSFDSVYPWSEMKHVKVSVAGVKILQTDAGYNAFDGELMTRIPEFWYKDYRSGGHRYLYISRKKRLGFKQKAEQLIASMPASKVGSEYRSRVGEAPETNISYTNFITGMYAQGDSEWSMYDSNTMHSIFMLSTIEGGSLNHKGMYGQGINYWDAIRFRS